MMTGTVEHVHIEFTKVDQPEGDTTAPAVRYSVIDQGDTTTNGHVRRNNLDDVILSAAAPIKPAYNDDLAAVWHTEGQTAAAPTMYDTNSSRVNCSTGQQAVVTRRPPSSNDTGQTRRVAVDRPLEMVCSDCGKVITTRVDYQAGKCSILACVGLAVFGCVFGCCLVPFCTNFFKDGIHTCPNCHSTVGVYKKL